MIFTSRGRTITVKKWNQEKFQQTLDASMMSTADRTNFKTVFWKMRRFRIANEIFFNSTHLWRRIQENSAKKFKEEKPQNHFVKRHNCHAAGCTTTLFAMKTFKVKNAKTMSNTFFMPDEKINKSKSKMLFDPNPQSTWAWMTKLNLKIRLEAKNPQKPSPLHE